LTKRHFCLFTFSCLCHFHVHMYYNPNWFISSICRKVYSYI
jgi:hypothetical protein